MQNPRTSDPTAPSRSTVGHITGKSRPAHPINKTIESRLSAYAVAAAAGVGLLATAQPVNADIIYTPAHKEIAPGGTAFLDLNHDGTNDFKLENTVTFFGGDVGFRGVEKSNGVLGTFSSFSGNGYGFKLASGARIGPVHGTRPAFFTTAFLVRVRSADRGYWTLGGSGYVGLRFQIDGQPHYGWAALTLDLRFTSFSLSYDELLTGYAYNTVAGQQILAGQTSTPEPGTLALLALGSLGLGLWRRKRAVAGSQ